jgi:DNA-binding transcriptional LysR family regulator
VDLGIVTEPGAEAGLVEIPLADQETVLVVYPEHPLAEEGAPRRAATAAQIASSPLIRMEEGTNLRTYTDGLLSAGGVREQVTLELDNIEAIKKMIEAGLGISLLPLLAVQAEVEAGRLVALPLADVPGARRRLVAVYRRDKYLSASLRAFVELLQSELAAAPRDSTVYERVSHQA